MSHTVKIDNLHLLQEAVIKAAEFLKLSYQKNGQATFFDRQVRRGLTVALPGWKYPLVITEDGSLAYDNYHGSWGKIQELNKVVGYALVEMQGEDMNSVFVKEERGQMVFETR